MRETKGAGMEVLILNRSEKKENKTPKVRKEGQKRKKAERAGGELESRRSVLPHRTAQRPARREDVA